MKTVVRYLRKSQMLPRAGLAAQVSGRAREHFRQSLTIAVDDHDVEAAVPINIEEAGSEPLDRVQV